MLQYKKTGVQCLLLLSVCLFSCKKQKVDNPKTGPGSCRSVSPAGHLSYNSSTESFVYTTKSGGQISVGHSSGVIITHKDYAGFKLEFWGDTLFNGVRKTAANHETLNGKHIKDRVGMRRTIIFPDGAKITFVANGEIGPLVSVSIYEDGECHHINPACNTLEVSAIDTAAAKAKDNAEADGEAGGFEFTSTGLLFVNFYTEPTIGTRVTSREVLGELNRSQPTQVRDYYDDPRLGHT